GGGRAGGTCSCPTVGTRVVLAAGVQKATAESTPDDHLVARPDCRVSVTVSGRAGEAGCYPTVGTWVVSAAGIQEGEIKSLSTPDDHFTASPDCRVRVSGSRRVSSAGGGPTVSAGIVSAAGDSHTARSEEHTSELQSPCNLVCRPLLEKKKYNPDKNTIE